jgi:hypothetical protein
VIRTAASHASWLYERYQPLAWIRQSFLYMRFIRFADGMDFPNRATHISGTYFCLTRLLRAPYASLG